MNHDNTGNSLRRPARVDDRSQYDVPIPRPEEIRESKPLLRNNFIMMIVSALLIVVGFILMTGGGSTIDSYNPDIFSTRRIVIGPLLSFLGYVLMAVAIVIKPKDK